MGASFCLARAIWLGVTALFPPSIAGQNGWNEVLKQVQISSNPVSANTISAVAVVSYMYMQRMCVLMPASFLPRIQNWIDGVERRATPFAMELTSSTSAHIR